MKACGRKLCGMEMAMRLWTFGVRLTLATSTVFLELVRSRLVNNPASLMAGYLFSSSQPAGRRPLKIGIRPAEGGAKSLMA